MAVYPARRIHRRRYQEARKNRLEEVIRRRNKVSKDKAKEEGRRTKDGRRRKAGE